jgi:hypothetical protein
MGFIRDNWMIIIPAALAVLAVARMLAKQTDTPKDDQAVEAASSFLQRLMDFLSMGRKK